MFITELIINILGFSVTLKQRAHWALKSCPLYTPILRPGDKIPLLQHTSSAIEVICRTSWSCSPCCLNRQLSIQRL